MLRRGAAGDGTDTNRCEGGGRAGGVPLGGSVVRGHTLDAEGGALARGPTAPAP